MTRYCSHCGKELKDSMKFCAYCGKACTQQAIPTIPDAKAPSRKTKKFPIVIAAIALVAAAIVCGALLLNGSDTNSQKEPETVEVDMNRVDAVPDQEPQGNIASPESEPAELFEDYETVTLLQSQVFYNEKMEDRYTYTYEYDDYGRLIGFSSTHEALFFINENGNYQIFNSATHDPDRDLVYRHCRTYKYTYTYDAAGNIQEITMTNDDGKEFRLPATYQNGLPVKYGDQSDYWVEITYNERNLPVSVIWYAATPRGEVPGAQTQLIYDDNGILLERHHLDYQNDTYIDKLDAEGRLIEQREGGDTDRWSSYTFSYNENGDICDSTSDFYNNFAEPDVMKFDYDDLDRLTGSYYEVEDGNHRVNHSYTFEGTVTNRATTKDLDTFGHGYTVEYDQAGNLLNVSYYDESRLLNQVEYTYLEKKVPQGYQKPDIKDPKYLLDDSEIYRISWEATDEWMSEELYYVFYVMEH